MKSKVTKVINSNTTWINKKYDGSTMYDFIYEFEDGTEGVASHKIPESKYKIGDEAEYEMKGQDPITKKNKIKFIQSKLPTAFNGYSKNQNKESMASFALSYTKDLVVAGTITIEQLLPVATKLNEWLNKNK